MEAMAAKFKSLVALLKVKVSSTTVAMLNLLVGLHVLVLEVPFWSRAVILLVVLPVTLTLPLPTLVLMASAAKSS